jgi:uncharacterized membrane protein YjgN (DUF898 family)
MTTLDAAVSAAPAPVAAPGVGHGRFLGKSAVFWRLLVRGGVLLMCTLGIYRFWLTTDVRRFLWANTELLGQSFEYTGTARELLLGFLIAIAILVPLYTVLFIVALTVGPIGELSGLLSFLLLAALGHYAIFRARRYRLTRTVYRGVRFHQAGSAWRYAICALFWWSLIFLTLGLAYPFALSRLERFKMRYTFFGDLPGRFEASGFELFARGALLWFIAIVPLVIGLVAALGAVDWAALEAAGRSNKGLDSIEASAFGHAMTYAGMTFLWLLLCLVILYPVFQTIVLRWWASGVRFGPVAMTSQLRMSKVIALYGRFMLYALLFTLVVIVLAAFAALAIPAALKDEHATSSEFVATAALVAVYVFAALGYATIYQATVRIDLWRYMVESLDVSGGAALERVSAAGEASSPVGEGLADALNVGGI